MPYTLQACMHMCKYTYAFVSTCLNLRGVLSYVAGCASPQYGTSPPAAPRSWHFDGLEERLGVGVFDIGGRAFQLENLASFKV